MINRNFTKYVGLLLILMLAISITGCRRSSEEEPLPEPAPTEIDNSSENAGEAGDPEETEQGDRHYYVLYLKHRDQAFIFSDTHSIRENDPLLADQTLSEFVIERLIDQKGVGELINPIHPDTKLLSLEQDGRKVTVNLSQEFVEGMTGTQEDTEATVAMVVNSLITLPGIDRVSLQIEGEQPDFINGLAIRDVYEFITEYYPDK